MKPTTVVSPSGFEEVVTDPARLNSLLLTAGYRIKAEPEKKVAPKPVVKSKAVAKKADPAPEVEPKQDDK